MEERGFFNGEQLKSFFADAESMLVGFDPQGHLRELNAAWERSLGHPMQEVLGCTYLDLVHPEDREKTRAAFACLFEGGELALVNRTRHLDQSWRWLSWRAPAQGAASIYWCEARDLTEEREGHKTRQKFDALMATMPHYIAYCDTQGVITSINRTYESLSTDQVIATHILNWIPSESRSQFDEKFQHVVTHAQQQEFVTRGSGPDGGPTWYHSSLGPVIEDGEVTGVTIIGQDVTLLKRVEQRHIQSAQFESIGRVSSQIAHNFNNVLTAISAISSLAELSEDRAELLGYLRDIEEATQQGAQLTRSLLSLSTKRVDSLQALDLNEVIRGSLPLLSGICSKRHRIELVLEEDLHQVQATRSHIEQILLNLITNANDALVSQEAHGTVQVITAKLSPDKARMYGLIGDCVMLCVRDDGPGIPADSLGKLFEPFFTTKGRGHGLGLASCYKLTNQLGGEISIQSQEGKGTTVTVVLPRAEHPQSPTEQQRAGHPGKPEGQKNRATILVAEDEPSIREPLCRYLARFGYKVLTGVHGGDALKVAQRHPGKIDLLLTDMRMPELGGRALIETLCAQSPPLKVLVISGHSDDLEWLQEQNIKLIQKPFHFRDLLEEVESLLAI